MFFFIGGGGTFTEVVGRGYTLACPYCHNTRPWDVLKSETRISVFFIPIARWGARFFAVCPICSTAARLHDRDEARRFIDTAGQPDPELEQEIVARAATEGIRF